VNKDPDAFIFLACSIGDVGEHHRFAGAGWRHDQRCPTAFMKPLSDFADDVCLVGSEDHYRDGV
jgi:hypothetical protein